MVYIYELLGEKPRFLDAYDEEFLDLFHRARLAYMAQMLNVEKSDEKNPQNRL